MLVRLAHHTLHARNLPATMDNAPYGFPYTCVQEENEAFVAFFLQFPEEHDECSSEYHPFGQHSPLYMANGKQRGFLYLTNFQRWRGILYTCLQ